MVSARSILIVMSLFSFFAAGCNAEWATIRTGTYNGQAYTVQERSSSGAFASTNSLDWRIQLGRMPAVPVNANTTDWGPPYTTDIYATDSYLYITAHDTAYTNADFMSGTTGVAHTMLYISPKTLSEEQYEDFYHFMRDEWPRLSDSLTGKDLRDFPHIIGLVYGAPGKFRHRFKGQHDGRSMVLTIENDGRVRLANDDKWAQENYSGLSGKVLMPGKRLMLDSNRRNGGLTTEELQAFRDERAVSVEKFFDIHLYDATAEEEKSKATRDMLMHKWHATHLQAGGHRQPLEGGEDGSYLWLQSGGIAEQKDRGPAKRADWSYDAATRSIVVLSDSARTTYSLRSITATELVLEQTGAAMGTGELVFRRVD